MFLDQTQLEILTQPPRKLQLWFLVSSSELTLSYFYMTIMLTYFGFRSSDWLELFHQDLHRQLFSSRNVFFKDQLLFVQSIVSVLLWQKISQCHCAFWLEPQLDRLFFSFINQTHRQKPPNFREEQLFWWVFSNPTRKSFSKNCQKSGRLQIKTFHQSRTHCWQGWFKGIVMNNINDGSNRHRTS